ncbi:GNAT family N-acetyltransferase [Bacillus spongiae]|uniref:GNAT family N-acetyltransferase n=1 Tax=Bacillus spongiae TaxID=2683610 RepID=A0ABU8HGW5_9BACI
MKIMQKESQNETDFIRKKLIEYNMSKLPDHIKTPKENICFVLKNDDGETLGGVTGTTYWQHLHIDILWVDEAIRHKGYGSQLLMEIERVAKEKGCRLICLDTLSFQAPDFYERNGYKVFGVIEDHPKGYNQYFLEKRLSID